MAGGGCDTSAGSSSREVHGWASEGLGRALYPVRNHFDPVVKEYEVVPDMKKKTAA